MVDTDYIVWWVALVSALSLFIINIPLLWIVKKTWDSSLINKLIGLDSFVALLHVPFIIQSGGVLDLRIVCW